MTRLRRQHWAGKAILERLANPVPATAKRRVLHVTKGRGAEERGDTGKFRDFKSLGEECCPCTEWFHELTDFTHQ